MWVLYINIGRTTSTFLPSAHPMRYESHGRYGSQFTRLTLYVHISLHFVYLNLHLYSQGCIHQIVKATTFVHLQTKSANRLYSNTRWFKLLGIKQGRLYKLNVSSAWPRRCGRVWGLAYWHISVRSHLQLHKLWRAFDREDPLQLWPARFTPCRCRAMPLRSNPVYLGGMDQSRVSGFGSCCHGRFSFAALCGTGLYDLVFGYSSDLGCWRRLLVKGGMNRLVFPTLVIYADFWRRT